MVECAKEPTPKTIMVTGRFFDFSRFTDAYDSLRSCPVGVRILIQARGARTQARPAVARYLRRCGVAEAVLEHPICGESGEEVHGQAEHGPEKEATGKSCGAKTKSHADGGDHDRNEHNRGQTETDRFVYVAATEAVPQPDKAES